MLKSGADVKIGAYEFMLATELAPGERAYDHFFENLFPEQSSVLGDTADSPNRELRFWRVRDWLAGEGQKYLKTNNPDRYWYANANTRVPGSITATPARTAGDTKTMIVSDPQFGGHFTVVGDKVWFFAGREGYYSSDGNTYTENADVQVELETTNNHEISAVTNDQDSPWVAAYYTTGTQKRILEVTSTTAATKAVTDRVGAGAYRGAGMVEGQMYFWTGGRLFRYDSGDYRTNGVITNTVTASTAAANSNPVYKPFIENTVASTVHKAADGETSMFMLKGGNGKTVIYEFKYDVAAATTSGRSIWNMPPGFTGKHMCTSLGILYVVGDYNGRAALFGMSTISRQPLFLGYFGDSVTLTDIKFMSGSYGPQVMIGAISASKNYIYIYDAEEDAFSQLDEFDISTNGTLSAGITFKEKRIVATISGTALKFFSWALDTTNPTSSGTFEWQSAAWDVERPEEDKTLFGIHVVQDPTQTSGTVAVYYQDNEDGVWTLAGNTSAGVANNYINIADASGVATSVKFRTLRLRMVGSGGARVFSITPRVYINTLQEVWRLVLDLSDEPGTARKPSNRAVTAAKLRGYLDTLINNKAVVEFQDGRQFSKKSGTVNEGYKKEIVVVERPKDSIDSRHEGQATVFLRSVTPV